MFTHTTQSMWDVLDPSVSAFSLSLYRPTSIYIYSLEVDPSFFYTLWELLQTRLEQDIRLNSKMKRETHPCLQKMENHIRSKSKVTGEGTRQPNGPDLVSLLTVVPYEDRCRTWASFRTIMLRRTSKRVKEQVDKMRLPVIVLLCELWRHDKYRSPPGGWCPRTTFHRTPSPSDCPNTMENLQIVMNQFPAMLRRCRIITLKLHSLTSVWETRGQRDFQESWLSAQRWLVCSSVEIRQETVGQRSLQGFCHSKCHGVSWHITTVSGMIPVLRYRGIYGSPMIFLGDQK